MSRYKSKCIRNSYGLLVNCSKAFHVSESIIPLKLVLGVMNLAINFRVQMQLKSVRVHRSEIDTIMYHTWHRVHIGK